MKKNRIILTLVGIVIVVVGIITLTVRNSSNKRNSSNTITIGSIGSDVQIWKHIADLPETKKEHLNIKVKSFTDGISLNTATAEGKIDVNAFQSYAYYVAFNKSSKVGKITALGTTYLEPMGIYSNRYKKVHEIPNGSTIALADNPANTARGLKLLERAGLIKLKADFGSLSGTSAIADNPHHFKFKEIDDTTGPRIMKDNSIAAVLIGNTIALEGKLNVLKDSIFHEQVNQSTKENINILATASKNKNDQNLKKLVKIYHSDSVQKYIKKEFGGTKIDVQKPLSYFEN
ncbi:methionine ABC transporter [Liquorilactobacillus sucicola DSM 21376 = JCM 15457]|uniref:Amino acid ABC transporter substrate-binding protein n=1 Tax=Liquorilactobacillus sucicola DSM 21376 = JCM 15457 TaxID=1423806 RepID=A0A023CW19_9LACO|nr:MetQ/NlpA family ABC transporter substrate-binding protein [Liquorilactobacillus sucicola]KRN05620.1 amino acid ABC transporter substrate-binding protein [Liquorilactobacillus sucicola DSM 21376 = JCM 15457]GAJ25705.1 methionine ABC transporter [Liquorilactobacillus sucicola DSM 21376 = JCM 15457]